MPELAFDPGFVVEVLPDVAEAVDSDGGEPPVAASVVAKAAAMVVEAVAVELDHQPRSGQWKSTSIGPSGS